HDHAGLDAEKRHAGDLGNITANADGRAVVKIQAKGLSLFSVIGRAFVVHGGTDDLKSQPSGAAGPRVGTGVIGIAGPAPAKKPAAKPAAIPAK
ncbi:MAG: superoxide dismutase family protein, partial [Pirellulaceae bacterium]|nr:superoxide dismutase family protein [Pirellulaceae bacterium]